MATQKCKEKNYVCTHTYVCVECGLSKATEGDL